MNKSESKLLTIIIITKNEETYIYETMASVLNAIKEMDRVEIILVDSCSTDKTIEISRHFPISIYQLRPEWRHTPAAGRYIGFRQAKGDYVLFLDGDSVLQHGFIEMALECFQNDSSLAAVLGKRIEFQHDSNLNIMNKIQTDFTQIGEVPKFVHFTKGTTIFRSSYLRAAGSFNPFLFSEEEAELSERLRNCKYRILAIPKPMIFHHALPRETFSTFFKRMQSNLHLGSGQIMRYFISIDFFKTSLFQRVKRDFQFTILLLSGFIFSVTSVMLFDLKPFLFYLMILFSIGILHLIKSKNLSSTLKFFAFGFLHAYSMILGFSMRPRAISEYPIDPVKIQ
ncbi:poly-beta-1,6-N-acetyl-D-glucosamine synthase [bacterium BMS3Abin03]|nr:poly-beta-1,6-N-acetyl-D-glucosamine synthase [bacterium BMS3Abin03]